MNRAAPADSALPSVDVPVGDPATVEVLLFGRLRQAASCGRLELPLPDPSTVAQLWRRAQAAFPALGQLAVSVRPAVNECFTEWDRLVRPGDRVAFLPPMSGG